MQSSTELNVCDVQKWVKDLFEDEIDMPDFEESSECLKLISNIICLDKECQKGFNEIITMDLYFADCYERRKEELCTTFGLDILIEELSPDIVGSIENVASKAMQMRLKEPSITNFLLSSSFLENKREDYLQEHTVVLYNQTKLSKKISDITENNFNIDRKLQMQEKKSSKKQVFKSKLPEQCKFIKIKIEEYKKRTKIMQKQLKSIGWTPSLSHRELVKRAEAIECLEKEVKSMNEKLNSYQNLPPNEMLAQLKVEEAKAKLEQLQNKNTTLFPL